MNLTLTDGNYRYVSLYLLDWDSTTRNETIDVIDTATNSVIDSRAFSNFNGGTYATWNVKGSVQFKLTGGSDSQAIAAAIFIDDKPTTGNTSDSLLWGNITGANSSTYTKSGTTISDDGTKYRAVVTNSLGSFTTNPANLSVGVTLTVSTLDTGGVRFVNDSGFQISGNTYSANSPVYLGYVPANGTSFYKLLELNGNVSVNTSNLTFSASGAIKTASLNSNVTLVSGGITSGSITSLVSGKIAGLTGSTVTVAGVGFTLDSLGFSPTGDNGNAVVQLQGSVALPGGLNLAVNGTNTVNITASGFSLTGASASLSNNFTLGGTTFTASNLTGSYTSSTNVFTVTGQGSANVTGFGNVVVNLGNSTVGSKGLV
jgi:hypothetical protein